MAKKLVVEIDCEGASFIGPEGEFSPEPELAFILTHFTARMMTWLTIQPGREIELCSSLGKPVGFAKLSTTGAKRK